MRAHRYSRLSTQLFGSLLRCLLALEFDYSGYRPSTQHFHLLLEHMNAFHQLSLESPVLGSVGL